MKENTIKVLVFEPGYKPYVKEIPNTLEAKQEIVGGLIEPVYYFDDVILIINEESKLFDGNPANFSIRTEDGTLVDVVYGNAFLCCDAGEEFGSVTDELVEKYKNKFERLWGKIGHGSLYKCLDNMLKDKEVEGDK